MYLQPRRRTQRMLDPVVHQELARHQAGGHDHPRAQPRKEPAEARLLREDAQAVRHRAGGAVAFVDLGEEGVCGLDRNAVSTRRAGELGREENTSITSNTHLAEDGGGETGGDAAPEVDGELVCAGEGRAPLLGHGAEGELVAELVDRELADRVRYLSVQVQQRWAVGLGYAMRKADGEVKSSAIGIDNGTIPHIQVSRRRE